MAHFVDDAHHGGSQFLGAVGLLDGDRDVRLDAAELLQEVDVEVRAAELAIGDALQAHVFLELHDLGDRLVLHGTKLLGGDFAACLLFARFEQVLRPEKTADVVIAGGSRIMA